jgi:FkbM family methyltransferase
MDEGMSLPRGVARTIPNLFARVRKRLVHAWSVAVGRRAALSARDGVWEALALIRRNCDQIEAALARLDKLEHQLERIEQAQAGISKDAVCLRNLSLETANQAAILLYDNILITRTLAGFKIVVDGQDCGSGLRLICDGVVDSPIGWLLPKIVKPGAVFLDVGAHYGYFALWAALLGGSESRIYAFEANPALAALIRRSALANGFSTWVEVFENAASDRTGKAAFGFDPLSPEGGSLALAHSSNDSISKNEVNCARIDDLLDSTVVADCILIDVGGHEQAVLRGMERVLIRSPDVRLIFKYDPELNDSDRAAINLIDEIASLGLSLWRIDGSGLLANVTREELRGSHTMHLLAARHRPDDHEI